MHDIIQSKVKRATFLYIPIKNDTLVAVLLLKYMFQ